MRTPGVRISHRRRAIDATTRLDRRAEVVDELNLADALHEPPDRIGRIVTLVVAGRSLRCAVLRMDVDLQRPLKLRDRHVEPCSTVTGEAQPELADEATNAPSCQFVEHATLPLRLGGRTWCTSGEDAEESPRPRPPWVVESLADALERGRRAQLPGEGVLDHRRQRRVVDVRVMSTTVRGGLVTRMPSGRWTTSASGSVAVRNTRTHAASQGLLRGGAMTWTRPSRGLRLRSHMRPAVGPPTTRCGRLAHRAAHRDHSSSLTPPKRYPPSTTRSSRPAATRRRRRGTVDAVLGQRGSRDGGVMVA